MNTAIEQMLKHYRIENIYDNPASQVGAFAATFLCCTFSLPAACKFSFCQVRFGA